MSTLEDVVMKIWAPSTNNGTRDAGHVGSETGIDEWITTNVPDTGGTTSINPTLATKLTNNIIYHGGPQTFLPMECYLIFVGDEWNSNTTWKGWKDAVVAQIKTLFTTSYFDWLCQYTNSNGQGIKRPVLKNGDSPAVVSSYKFPASYNETTDATAALNIAISSGLVPAYSRTKQNVAYLLFGTPDRTPAWSPATGIHKAIAFSDDATLYQSILIEVNTTQTFANWIPSFCHELVEMLADNSPHKGFDNKSGSTIPGTAAGDEICDVCRAGGTGWTTPTGSNFQVAKYYSDIDGACVSPWSNTETFTSCPVNYCWSEKQQLCLGIPGLVTPTPTPIPTVTPTPTPTPTVTPTVTPTPVPSGGVDLENIQMLYMDDVTKASQTFFLHREGPNHARVSGKGTRKLNSDGTVTITPTSSTNPATARIYIGTTNPNFQDITTQLIHGHDWGAMINFADPDGVHRGGWMMDNFDWRDVEFSIYYRIPKINTDDEMTQYLGGNHPSDDTWPENCVSSCYKAQIQTQDCSPRAAIEWDHIGGSTDYAWNDTVPPAWNLKSELGGSMNGKLLGQKWVRYNEIGSDGLLKAVHMELYVDTGSKDLPQPDYTKQNWRLFAEYVHNGHNWPSSPPQTAWKTQCNGSSIIMPAWGASILAIRFDESPWTMYSLSARPIKPIKLTTRADVISPVAPGGVHAAAAVINPNCTGEGRPPITVYDTGGGVVTPTPTPTPTSGGTIGPDGVLQIYDSLVGGNKWYLNMAAPSDPADSKFNISYGTGSHIKSTKHTEGSITYFNSVGAKQTYASGSPDSRSCRFDNYPGGGMFSNNTSYSYKSNPGYLYNPQGIMNKEITIYLRPHGQLKTHESCAFKLNGREPDDIRSAIEIVYATATHPVVIVQYNYEHMPYVDEPNVKNLFTGDKFTDGNWVGVKAILMISDDKTYCYLAMWVDLTPFKTDGTPSNTWKLKAECIAKGCKEYLNIPPKWKCHKDVMRADGFESQDYLLYSNIEITNKNIKTTI
jgi:hypothetical protein